MGITCACVPLFFGQGNTPSHFPHMSQRNIPAGPAENINCVPDLELCMYVRDCHCVCVRTQYVCSLSPFARRDSVPMIEAVSAAAGADAVCTLANHLLSRGFATALNAAEISKITIFSFIFLIKLQKYCTYI